MKELTYLIKEQFKEISKKNASNYKKRMVLARSLVAAELGITERHVRGILADTNTPGKSLQLLAYSKYLERLAKG